MSNLVAGASLELQNRSAGYWFTIPVGGLSSVPTVRRAEITIPGKSGLTYGEGVAETRIVVVKGHVFGDAGMSTTARQSFLSRMQALLAVFDVESAPFALTIHPTALAVGGQLNTGETATLNVIFDRMVTSDNPDLNDEGLDVDMECRCIDDPPEWVISGGS